MFAYAWYSTSDGAIFTVIKGCDIGDVPTAKSRLGFLCGEYMANPQAANLADVTDDPLLDAASANHLAYAYRNGHIEPK